MLRTRVTVQFFSPVLETPPGAEAAGRRSISTGFETPAIRAASAGLEVSTALESPSPLLDPLQQTIKDYFRIYCEQNLTKLCHALGKVPAENLINGIQSVATPAELDNHLKILAIRELQIICRVFHRLLTGNLSKQDSLIQKLTSVAPKTSLPELSDVVGQEMRFYTSVFFNPSCAINLHTSSPTPNIIPTPGT